MAPFFLFFAKLASFQILGPNIDMASLDVPLHITLHTFDHHSIDFFQKIYLKQMFK